MIRLVVKLVIAGLVVNAVWRVGAEYLTFYSLQDEIRIEAARGDPADLRERVLEIAAELDVPLNEDDVGIRQDEQRVVVEGAYVKRIPFLPGYAYPWPFRFDVDAYLLQPVRRRPR
jgi:hypothetical protein